MTEASLARVLLAYGDARFGDEWWPVDARPWIGEEAAGKLSAQLRNGIEDADEAARLIDLYGEAKFGDKWRPEMAASVLEGAEGLDMPMLVAGIRQESTAAFSAA